MIQVGDKVRVDVGIVEENGMNENDDMINRFNYILAHPDEVYEVSSISCEGCLAPIQVAHPILGATSFFEDELIVVKRGGK